MANTTTSPPNGSPASRAVARPPSSSASVRAWLGSWARISTWWPPATARVPMPRPMLPAPTIVTFMGLLLSWRRAPGYSAREAGRPPIRSPNPAPRSLDGLQTMCSGGLEGPFGQADEVALDGCADRLLRVGGGPEGDEQRGVVLDGRVGVGHARSLAP